MGLLISLWVECFIVLVARQYWSGVVTVSKKVAGWLTGVLYFGTLLRVPLIAIPVLLILGLDASMLTLIGICYLSLMMLSFAIYGIIRLPDDDEW